MKPRMTKIKPQRLAEIGADDFRNSDLAYAGFPAYLGIPGFDSRRTGCFEDPEA
jgi:hypothetical protein